MDPLVGPTKSGVEHDPPDGFLNTICPPIFSVDQDGCKGLPVRLDRSSKAIVQSVAHEVVGKVAWAIISRHENVCMETDHVIHSGANQALGDLCSLLRSSHCAVVLEAREQSPERLHEVLSTKQFSSS